MHPISSPTLFLTHSHTQSSAAAVFQQNVLKLSIINESVCSWFIPHTNKIPLFCRAISRLKQSAGSLFRSLSWEMEWGSFQLRKHAEGLAYLLPHAGKQSVFSAGCLVHRRPVETPHSSHLQNKKQPHSLFLSVHARLTLITKEDKYHLTGCLRSVTTRGEHLLHCMWHKYCVWIKGWYP